MTSTEFQDAPTFTPQQALNFQNSLAYIEAIKTAYQDQPDVYQRFLDIMGEFTRSSINIPQMIDHVVDLFQGRPELIQGLNTFLPAGYHLQVAGNSVIITTPSGVTTRPF